MAVGGYRRLQAGQDVALEWEAARQDGFDYRATRVWPWGAEPTPERPENTDGGGYFSSLRLEFGD